MNIDLTSFSFCSNLESGTGTPSWGTSLGQSKPDYKFTYEGSEEIVVGMTYCAVNLNYVYLPLGKGNSVPKKASEYPESKVASLFKKVYVNDVFIGCPFVMVLVTEFSDSHYGRHSIKYSEKNYYYDGKDNFSNSDFLSKVREKLNITESACWFVYEIKIINQDELYLSAIVIDKDKPKQYANSQERKDDWIKAIECKTKNKYVGLSSGQSILLNAGLTSFSYSFLLTALRTKPFLLLAGISGTGKSRIVRELAFASCPKKLQDNDGTTPGNYCMIEVKPNWHDSSELLGYYSNISKKYIFTKFVKFLVKAKMYPDVPFFVCLDEMNLAPVEQYFAEYLSVLETRKKAENEIKTGVLVCNEHFKNLNLSQCKNNKDIYLKLFELNSAEEIDDSVANQSDLLTLGLTLPDNVFVIGTVNMDDTTHQFSRKVIDRAMTIEMNGGDLMGMFGGSAKLSYREENDLLPLGAFRPSYVNADEVLDAHTSCAEQIKQLTTDKLNAINACLKNTPFVVSYRVLNELVIYLGNLLDDNGYKADGNDDTFKTFVDTAVDRITLMKILPRVEGDEDMFRIENESQNRLEKLQNLFSPSVSKNEEGTLEVNDKGNDVEVQKENIEDKKTDDSSNSYQKLKDMIERLESGFTRFWP